MTDPFKKNIVEVIDVYDPERGENVSYNVKVSVAKENKKEVDEDIDIYIYMSSNFVKNNEIFLNELDKTVSFFSKKIKTNPDGHTNSNKIKISRKTNKDEKSVVSDDDYIYIWIVKGESATYQFLVYILMKLANLLHDRFEEEFYKGE